jgi:hypothetical protein
VRRGLGHGRGRSGHGDERGGRIGSDHGDGTCGDRGGADLGRLAVDVRRSCARHHHDRDAGYATSHDHHARYATSHDHHAHHSAHHRRLATAGDADHHELAADVRSRRPAAHHTAMHGWIHERRDRRSRGERDHGSPVTPGGDLNVAGGRRDFLVWSGANGRPGSGCDADHRCRRHRGCCWSQRPGPVTALSGTQYGWPRAGSGRDADTTIDADASGTSADAVGAPRRVPRAPDDELPTAKGWRHADAPRRIAAENGPVGRQRVTGRGLTASAEGRTRRRESARASCRRCERDGDSRTLGGARPDRA